MAGTDPSQAPDERLIDLVIKELGEPLSDSEMRSLETFDAADVGRLRRDLERAAAAVTLAARLTDEPLPGRVHARLERQAADFFARPSAVASASSTPGVSDLDTRDRKAPAGEAPVTGLSVRATAVRRPPALGNSAGWWAAAACLALAAVGWLRSPSPLTASPASTTAGGLVDAAPSPATLRAQLLASGHALRAEIPAGKDPASSGVTGDVVWDPVSQRGYMRFVGLKPNDPALQQYQIWVFDAGRDQRYPVDGGIFDVPACGGDIVIPIRVGVPVRAAKAFAVTVEKPGGVVVSAREHIVALAQLT